MTFLQGGNILIGLLLYPYLIRTLGQSAYGTYVFAGSCINFFILFISFGFTFPALKKISLHADDSGIKNETVSSVFTAKFYLFILSAVILTVLIFAIPFFRENYLLYIIIFSITICDVLFPTWYFQGIQKMKLVTYIQLGTKLLIIPFIFIFIKSPEDLLLYAVIFSLSNVLGAVISVFYLRIKEHIHIRFVPFCSMKMLFRDALPFFWTSAVNTVKREGVTLIIGSFFGMKDVALYDLANKIVSIPRLITLNINDAVFPRAIKDINAARVKKIIRYEALIGLTVTLLIIAFGYWAVLFLGGESMTDSYVMAIVLSTTIFTWLVVGCYVNYVFVPQNRYYFVTQNQILASVSFFILCGTGLLAGWSILSVILAYALSGVVEIFYCKYLIKKHRLL
ncbi:MAG: oligosaccharide flippase family protein [Prevotellaceae bacterium]|jgi:PST family polysaccharide transporter|nr:oligosaccharide flippase family protein [Prevotellaceae bacterium]